MKQPPNLAKRKAYGPHQAQVELRELTAKSLVLLVAAGVLLAVACYYCVVRMVNPFLAGISSGFLRYTLSWLLPFLLSCLLAYVFLHFALRPTAGKRTLLQRRQPRRLRRETAEVMTALDESTTELFDFHEESQPRQTSLFDDAFSMNDQLL